jgi:transposase
LTFRREAVSLLKRSGKSVPVLAAERGVSPQSLSRQLDVDAGKAEGLTSDERDELRRLRRENGILTEEGLLAVGCEERVRAGGPKTGRVAST